MRKIRVINLVLTGAVVLLGLWGLKSLLLYSVLAGLLVVVTGLVNFYRRPDYLWPLLPSLLLLGLFGTIAAVSSLAVKVFLVGAVGVLFYFYQNFWPRPVPEFLEEATNLTSAILLLTFVLALGFYFALSWWVLILLIFVLSLLMFWQAFLKLTTFTKSPLVDALVSSLILIQLLWAVLYWPAHFLTGAVTAFAGFYLIYIISRLYFQRRLTKKKIYFQSGLMLVLLFLSLLSSRWSP